MIRKTRNFSTSRRPPQPILELVELADVALVAAGGGPLALPGAIDVFGHHETSIAVAGGRVGRRVNAAEVECLQLVQGVHERLAGQVAAGEPKRVDEERRVAPTIDGEQVELAARIYARVPVDEVGQRL
jgi:hypothetical protein